MFEVTGIGRQWANVLVLRKKVMSEERKVGSWREKEDRFLAGTRNDREESGLSAVSGVGG